RPPPPAPGHRPEPLDVWPRCLDQRAVFDARWARRLARAAAEAEVQVPDDLGRGRELALFQRADQVDAAARRVGLHAELDVGRTRGEAEPAVDAGEELLARDEAGLRAR